MAIFAYSETALVHLTDLLHDLYFPLPHGNLVPENRIISIQFFDRDRILRKDVISEFRCSIHQVVSSETEGRIEKCPDPIYFNEFEYKKGKGSLVLMACSPLKIKFQVTALHLELEQLV